MSLKIIVTAGPTQEPIDPVRYISNFSTGNMGYEIAKEAKRRKHQVILISGPVNITAPKNVRLINIQTAQELLSQLKRLVKGCDCLIMAAAVADFRVKKIAKNKLKRQKDLTLKLAKTQDLLKALAKFKHNKIFVGFALESKNILSNALKKLKEKKLDLIVANQINRQESPFGADRTTVWFCGENRQVKKFPSIPKSKVAKHLLDRVEELCYCKKPY